MEIWVVFVSLDVRKQILSNLYGPFNLAQSIRGVVSAHVENCAVWQDKRCILGFEIPRECLSFQLLELLLGHQWVEIEKRQLYPDGQLLILLRNKILLVQIHRFGNLSPQDSGVLFEIDFCFNFQVERQNWDVVFGESYARCYELIQLWGAIEISKDIMDSVLEPINVVILQSDIFDYVKRSHVRDKCLSDITEPISKFVCFKPFFLFLQSFL